MQDGGRKILGNIGNGREGLLESHTQNWKEEQPYIYWMTSVEGIGSRTIEKLVNHAGSPRKVYGLKLSDMLEIIPKSKAEALLMAKREGDILEKYNALKQKGIQFISIYHPYYPKRLKNIPDAPFGIYVEGKLPEEDIPSIAVIGARQCSDYGRFMAQRCGKELALEGVNVISGMAKGIDGISQRAALEAGGKTYAVLGCGTDICYPSENRNVYIKAKENGAVISEYPPGTKPVSRLFPRRNRIISGLADIVLIVEAREKSGTLITADMALEQGKEVYVIPGRITDCLSQGCLRLIKQGAGIFTNIGELLEETGLRNRLPGKSGAICLKTGRNGGGLEGRGGNENGGGQEKYQGKKEKKILDILDFYPKNIDRLMQETGMEYRELICALSRLCMEEKAVKVGAGQFKKG
ncbi:DNA-protecting protein DprA [Lachnospiraceae bacterium]|nr:DNA-protecting protein DprA [Lachnospiraceae bacterium]